MKLVPLFSRHHCIARRMKIALCNSALTLQTVIFLEGIFVGSSSSSSIASPNYLSIYHTSSPGDTCSWEISTANGYILQLTFDKMSISSCSGCYCGYVEVRDGSTSGDPILGRYCNGNRPSLVSSKGSAMFVKYYGQHRFDSFRATVRSKKGNS